MSRMIPYTRTAQRPAWDELPAPLRAAIADRFGEIASTRVAGGGFTQGFAAVVTTVGGLRRFVKAAPLDSPPAEWYAQEARITAALPDGVPAARVQWTAELAGHYVICMDAVDATLAGLAGYYVTQSTRPEIPTSPYVRTHQRYYGLLAVDWLARRQAWR
jgi:hypothetical protein